MEHPNVQLSVLNMTSYTKTTSSELHELHDSGIDCEEAPFELPDKQMIQRIVQQVEQIFDDDNLIRDEFIAKNLRKNKGGFVKLKLIVSLRKVKTICKDWRVVAYAIGVGSSLLELDECGTKLRRKQPIDPVDSGSKYNRTIFVINLPESKEDIEKLQKDFSIFGRIGLIRVIQSSGTHPSHVKLLNHVHHHIGSLPSGRSIAAVEFNHRLDAELCLEQQSRLTDIDTVWNQAQLYIIKKTNIEEGKVIKPAKTPIVPIKKSLTIFPSITIPSVNSMTINNNNQCLHRNSRQISSISNNNQNIVRLPHAPSGNRGFKSR